MFATTPPVIHTVFSDGTSAVVNGLAVFCVHLQLAHISSAGLELGVHQPAVDLHAGSDCDASDPGHILLLHIVVTLNKPVASSYWAWHG